MNQEVTDYIKKLPVWQIEVCESLRKMVFGIIPDSVERLQYGKPHYLKNGHYAGVISYENGSTIVIRSLKDGKNYDKHVAARQEIERELGHEPTPPPKTEEIA